MPTAEHLVRQFNDLKTLPHVAIKVTQLINSPNTTMRAFEEVIKLDPILVLRLLRMVNSPFFGLANKVESISKAVVFVGMKNLRNLVAVEALRDLFKEDKKNTAFSRKNLWLHSATVAILCKMIAIRIFSQEGEDAFLTGIIHDIGMIVEDQVIGTNLRAVCEKINQEKRLIVDIENELIETNHCKVGALLCADWKMQDGIIHAIKYHHSMAKKHPIPSLCSILQIANYIAGRVNYSAIPGIQSPLPAYLLPHMKNKVAEYKILIKDLPKEITKAKDLYETEDDAK